MQRPLEYCFMCDEPTGRAGQGDGSLYCECDKGPFCEDCWDIHHNADTKIADLLEALIDLERFVTESVATSDDLHEVVLARKAIEKAKS